jgi:hypothetical protein
MVVGCDRDIWSVTFVESDAESCCECGRELWLYGVVAEIVNSRRR